MKDKTTAYILCLIGFLGIGGLHRLYLGRIGTGIIWLCTGGLCGFGTLFDLFSISSMVDTYNAIHFYRGGGANINNNMNNIMINIPPQQNFPPQQSVPPQ